MIQFNVTKKDGLWCGIVYKDGRSQYAADFDELSDLVEWMHEQLFFFGPSI